MRSRFLLLLILALFSLLFSQKLSAQKKAVIAYYSGSVEGLDSFSAKNMTHIIYCFGHLSGNKLHLGRQRDTVLIKKMAAMKTANKDLKVLLSLGGWGGCAPCSDIFNTAEGRTEFARSVKELTDYFGSDGIDLDWEYPTIEGYPGHKYMPADKQNFTDLVIELRKLLGKKSTITFAAGGFQKFLEESVDWKNVMPHVDFVNLMTYDLVNGYSTITGHHTGLYSTPSLKESTDNCVSWLIKNGVDPKKLIIGAAFYSRVWEGVPDTNNGLYQTGKFKGSFGFNQFPEKLKGFTLYWDDIAKAPYAYNATDKLFATYDDKRSIEIKSKYVLDKKLGGIMFWHLGHDNAKDGLVDVINKTFRQ